MLKADPNEHVWFVANVEVLDKQIGTLCAQIVCQAESARLYQRGTHLPLLKKSERIKIESPGGGRLEKA
jgi:hypothetical protein